MFIHGGVSLYGKVDQVPGLFYVATRFFHLYWLPLIPLKSYVIRDGMDEESGKPIGVNVKSIAFAWFRLALLLGAGLCGIALLRFGFRAFEGKPIPWPRLATVCGLLALAVYVLYASYGFARARPLRALQLARIIGVSPEEVAQHFVDWDSLPGLEEASARSAVSEADDRLQMTND